MANTTNSNSNPTLVERKAAVIAQMRATADQAEKEGRTFSADEIRDLEAKDQQVRELTEQIARAKQGAKIVAALRGDSPSQGGERHLNTKAFGGIARKVAEMGVSREIQGLTAVPEATNLFDGAPVQQFGEVGTLAQLLPMRTIASPNFEWFVEQDGYQPKADIWSPDSGQPKPESTTTFARKRAELAIVALMSGPMQRYDLTDAPALVEATVNRLMWDLSVRMDQVILEGSEAHGMTGLRNTSGTLVQHLVSDRLITIRHAISELEAQAIAPSAVVLSVNAWREIETSRTTDGEFVFASGPVDRAEKRIWGVPVVVTTQVAQDEAYVLDANSAAVHMVSGEPIFVETSDAHGDDFAHNRTRIRMEARYGVSVTRPSGVVKVDFGTPAA